MFDTFLETKSKFTIVSQAILETNSDRMENNNNNNNVNNNNVGQDRDPLVNMRDRLFHTLFFRLSLAYAR